MSPPVNFLEAHTSGIHQQIGFSADVGTDENTYVTMLEVANLGTSDNDSVRGNNQAGRSLQAGAPPTTGNSNEIITYTSTGFTIAEVHTGPGAQPPLTGGLAVRPSTARVHLDTNRAFPVVDTLVNIPTGWKPGVALTYYGRNTSNGSAQAQAFMGVGFHDFALGGDGECFNVGSQHNLSTTNTGSRWEDDRFIATYGSSLASLQTEAVIANPTADDFDLDFTVTVAAARKYSVLVIESLAHDPIAAAVTGTATVSGTLTAAATSSPIAAAITGTGTVAGDLEGTGELEASVSGAATVSGTLAARAELEATVAGAATVVGTLAAQAALEAALAGAATVAGTLSAQAELEAAAAGQATVAGDLVGRGELEATAAGTATVSGTLVDATTSSPIAAAVTGAATVQGTLTGRLGAQASIAGAATTAGTLTAQGELQGTSAGQATVAGTLSGTAAIEAAASGSAVVAGTLGARAELEAQAAGSAAVSGTLLGAGELEVAITGTATVGGTLVNGTEGAGTAALAGTATVLATLTARGELAAGIAGLGSTAGTLGGRAAIAAALSGQATVGPTLEGLADLAAAITGTAVVSATVTPLAFLAAALSGASTVNGTLTARGELVAALAGLAIVNGLAADTSKGCFEMLGVIARTRFEVEVVTPYPGTLPVIYSNELEVDGAGVPVRPEVPHCEVDIVTGVNEQVATSGPRIVWKKTGRLVALTYVPVDSSWAVATDIAERIEVAFDTVVESNVYWTTPTTEVKGREGAWYVLETGCPFHAFEHRDRILGEGDGDAQLNDIFAMVEARLWDKVLSASGLMVGWPNINFDPPNDLHVEVTHRPGERIRLERGLESHTRPGVTLVDVFAPVGDGDMAAVALGDLLVDSMSSVRQDGVLLEVSNLERLGRAGPYYQVQVTIPWAATVVTTT